MYSSSTLRSHADSSAGVRTLPIPDVVIKPLPDQEVTMHRSAHPYLTASLPLGNHKLMQANACAHAGEQISVYSFQHCTSQLSLYSAMTRSVWCIDVRYHCFGMLLGCEEQHQMRMQSASAAPLLGSACIVRSHNATWKARPKTEQ